MAYLAIYIGMVDLRSMQVNIPEYMGGLGFVQSNIDLSSSQGVLPGNLNSLKIIYTFIEGRATFVRWHLTLAEKRW